MVHFFHFLVTLTLIINGSTASDVNKNSADDNMAKYAEAAAELLQDPQNLGDLGDLVNNFVQSDNAKNMGDMLMGSINNKEGATQQILKGLGEMLKQKDGKGIDSSLLQNVLGSVIQSQLQSDNQEDKQNVKIDLNSQILGNLLKNFLYSNFGNAINDKGNIDIISVLSTLGKLMSQGDGKISQSLLRFLPALMSLVGIESDGEGNETLFWPSVAEKMYTFFGNIMNSETGKKLMNAVVGPKILNVFADKDGKFSATRTMELLQNHSFRRHWIEMITKRIASIISYFTDPENQRRFVKTAQYFSNSFLKNQGFPKAALFDPDRPDESITALINYASKKYLNQKINAKQYVKPAVEYIQQLMKIGAKRGLFGSGIDSKEFSDKLADTINLEVIEPVIRVYRAYRFVKINPKCDKYVFCLINQDNPNEPISLPGLKKGLSKATSLLVSWFVSKNSGTSFWTIYDIITEDKHNCKSYYYPICNDFHLEEEKVTTEYVHNEL